MNPQYVVSCDISAKHITMEPHKAKRIGKYKTNKQIWLAVDLQKSLDQVRRKHAETQ